MSRGNWATRLLVAFSWAAAVAAFALVSGHATGAVDACTSRQGYAPVPVLFWPLLTGSIAVAAVAVATASARRVAWLSLAGIIVAALVSLVVFVIGYSCGLG